MGNLVNITAGGAFAPQTDAPAPPAISGMSFGLLGSVNASFVNLALATNRSYFTPIHVASKRNLDAFVFQTSATNLTNDLELALYNIDTTGAKLGTKIVGATQTASFTASTYTEITFTSTEVDAGWYWFGISGIAGVAGPNVSTWDIVGVDTPSPIDGFGITGGWDTLAGIGHFTANVQLDTVAVGAALTSVQAAASVGIPVVRLRNA